MAVRMFVVAVAFVAALVGLAPMAAAGPYRNCKAAAADGVYNIPSSSYLYGPWLDRDNDGIGCES